MSDILVIGAGVIGLSAALRLQKAGYSVTIIARDFPSPSETVDNRALIHYASHWAGAHNRWIIPPDPLFVAREHEFAMATYRHMDSTAKEHPEAGISFMKGIEYYENPSPAKMEMTTADAHKLGLEDFRLLVPSEFPDEGVKWGCEYRTWCVNPMVYCSFLLRRFCLLGGQVIRQELRHIHEAFIVKTLPGVRTVINCSGIGFHDPDVVPVRGQNCLIANSCDVTITRQNLDGSWVYCIPRPLDGGTIVGGTRDWNDWNVDPDIETRERRLAAMGATYPSILANGPLRPLADIVGRRPTRRGGMRLEVEDLPAQESEDRIRGLVEAGARRVIHAYGLGGRGYELSWGVAERVLELVKGCI